MWTALFFQRESYKCHLCVKMYAVKSGEKQDPSLLVIPIRYSKTSIWSQHLARQHSRHLAHSPCCVAQVIPSVANSTIFTTVFYLTGQLQQAATRRSARWPSSCRAKSEGQQLKRPSFCSSQVQMTGGAEFTRSISESTSATRAFYWGMWG